CLLRARRGRRRLGAGAVQRSGCGQAPDRKFPRSGRSAAAVARHPSRSAGHSRASAGRRRERGCGPTEVARAMSSHRPNRRYEGSSHRHRLRAVLIALAAVVVTAAMAALSATRGWFGARDRERPAFNILLVTLDTTRADRIGAYGYARARTSHLDRFAAEGVRFDRVIAPAPITLPSHASLFTARYPFAHGVRN